ncbi:MAG: hypothetical protein M1834_004555 [Cirrosporium novae-zelandiae]|nr:MAG: hypothetical protein M1834_004555 [Cirrosporium novae-zelandiae]
MNKLMDVINDDAAQIGSAVENNRIAGNIEHLSIALGFLNAALDETEEVLEKSTKEMADFRFNHLVRRVEKSRSGFTEAFRKLGLESGPRRGLGGTETALALMGM